MADPFSGKAGRLAAMWGIQNLNNAQAQGGAALDQGRDVAASYLLGGEGSSADALTTSLGISRDYLKDYTGQAIGKLGEAGDTYNPMISAGSAGLGQYMNLVGLGPNGSAGMTDALRATPGYDFARTEGLDAITRGAAARGSLGSGNTAVDAGRYATGFADQTYGSALNRLSPLLGMFSQGTAGKANAIGGQAQLLNGLGTGLANQETAFGNNMAGLFGKAADLNFNTGAAKANLASSIGQGTTQLGVSGMMAGQQAAQNQLGAILGGVQGAAGLAGGLAKLFG